MTSELKPEDAHEGRYNTPTIDQVAAIIPGFENEKKNRDIVLYCKPTKTDDDFYTFTVSTAPETTGNGGGGYSSAGPATLSN